MFPASCFRQRTYVSYMCMLPACCLRQRTYVAQGLVNGVLNETWTHSCLQFDLIFSWFGLVLYRDYYVRHVLRRKHKARNTHTHTHTHIYMCVCVCVCVYTHTHTNIHRHVYTYTQGKRERATSKFKTTLLHTQKNPQDAHSHTEKNNSCDCNPKPFQRHTQTHKHNDEHIKYHREVKETKINTREINLLIKPAETNWKKNSNCKQQVQSWLQASNNTGILNTCTRLWLTELEQVTSVDSIKEVVRSSV